MRHLLLTLICSAYFAVLSVGAQTVPAPLQKVTLANWLGLNTADGDLNVDPRFMRKAHNVDFSRYGLNVIGARRGSSSRMSIAGADSITGLGAFHRLDGQRQLVFSYDSATVGYGSLSVTRIGSDSVRVAGDTSRSPIKLVRFWSPQAVTTMDNSLTDLLIASNGVQKPIIYNGKYARTLPMATSGEPILTPIYGGGTMDGEYRYMFSNRSYPGPEVSRSGYISDLVRVESGSVIVQNFPFYKRDSGATFDSTQVFIYRTRPNPGEIDPTDTFFAVGRMSLTSVSVDTYFVDTHDNTLPDASALFTSHTWIAWSTSAFSASLGYMDRVGREQPDHSGAILERSGAPVYMTRTFNGSDSTKNLWRGVFSNRTRLGAAAASISYMLVLNDSTGRFPNRSDSSVSLHVSFTPKTSPYVSDSLTAIKLIIPPPPAGITNAYWTLYRQHSYYGYDLVYRTNGSIAGYSPRYNDSLVRTGYYPVSNISLARDTFTDNIPFDSINDGGRFTSSTPLTMSQIQGHDGRLFGVSGTRLYESDLDTDSLYKWGAFSFVDFGSGGRDAINTFYPTRTAIRAWLNNSNWNVYKDANGEYSQIELVGSYGATPRTHAAGNSGHFVLTTSGQVIFEQDGTSLERTFTSAVVSEKLRNFANLSADIKSKAVGFYLPEEEKYLLNIDYGSVDTTFCWDVRAGTWSTWDLSIGHATLFDTGSVGAGIPSRTMYYVPRGTASIYRYPDTTNAPEFVDFQTVPLLRETFGKSQITGVGLWGRFAGGGISPTMYFYNEDLTFIGSTALPAIPTFNRFQRLKTVESKPALMHSLRFVWTGSYGEAWIDGLDLEYKASASGVAR